MSQNIVKQTIDDWDPCGFLAMGAPDGEYDRESVMIALQVTENNTIEEITDIVANVFNKQFSGDGFICNDFTREKCLDIAKKLKERFMKM